eukprot:Lithocolla_globosa_v1_NODE_4224_length_1483_cov_44.808123.p1 type:complete len:313 gc:universal NODE_4224_length_1483_cov_44.808123:1265-327(-)
MNYVANARRTGDRDSDFEVLANGAKLAGNGAAGNCIINKFTHNSVTFTESMDRTYQAVNKPKFKQLNEFGIESNTIFEITSGKKTIKLDNAVHIGCMVYNWAKVRMLSFYYDHLDKYHDRCDFALIEMDTDSFYIAITVDSFDKLPIKPGMEAEYLEDRWIWLVNPENNAYEKRTPGLFKEEYSGDKMIALSSKTYCVVDKHQDTIESNSSEFKSIQQKIAAGIPLTKTEKKADSFKLSSKGVSKSQNSQLLVFDNYKKVIDESTVISVENRGMKMHGRQMATYSQIKNGLTNRYDKRIVLADGVTCLPLNI